MSDLVEKVACAIWGELETNWQDLSPEIQATVRTEARAAIVAVLDDLMDDPFPDDAHIDWLYSRRKEIALASPQEPADAPKPLSPTETVLGQLEAPQRAGE